MSKAWQWLLGRTPAGAWRHVAYRSEAVGQGTDPAEEPRVEVVRRLIAYPARVFEAVVEAARQAEDPAHPLHWLCYRDPGEDPARPYWLCFVSERAGGRRFHFGLQLFDRERVGLWFFSGYAPEAVSPDLLASFPTNPSLRLPRVELRDENLADWPLGRWLHEALRGELRFAGGPRLAQPSAEDSLPPTKVGALHETLLSLPPPGSDLLGLGFARARLVVDTSADGGSVTLHPLGRLSTLVGRDVRCDVRIDHPNVSAEHLRITFRDGRPGLEELGSKNGTTVDGVAVDPREPVPLPHEALLSVGGVPCLFVHDPAPEVRAPEAPPPASRHE
ncbi:MAG: FHA domain-containing protein, partial [Planctomycetota bacterium]